MNTFIFAYSGSSKLIVAKPFALECNPSQAPTIVESIYEQTQNSKFIVPKFTLDPSSCFDLEISYRVNDPNIEILMQDDYLFLYPAEREVSFNLIATVEGGQPFTTKRLRIISSGFSLNKT